MRDIDNDSQMGKRTLVVRLGTMGAKIYHVMLITFSMFFSFIYTLKYYRSVYQFIFILTFPLFIMNIISVIRNAEPLELNRELKKLALSTFVFALSFGIGQIL